MEKPWKPMVMSMEVHCGVYGQGEQPSWRDVEYHCFPKTELLPAGEHRMSKGQQGLRDHYRCFGT